MEKTFSEKIDSFTKELIDGGIQEKKPVKANEIPCLKHEFLEGRTLFDDYFLAVLHGVSTSAASSAPEDIEDIPDMLASFSYEVATLAIKKREEYFSEGKHERS
jgi:hypothetical protein